MTEIPYDDLSDVGKSFRDFDDWVGTENIKIGDLADKNEMAGVEYVDMPTTIKTDYQSDSFGSNNDQFGSYDDVEAPFIAGVLYVSAILAVILIVVLILYTGINAIALFVIG